MGVLIIFINNHWYTSSNNHIGSCTWAIWTFDSPFQPFTDYQSCFCWPQSALSLKKSDKENPMNYSPVSLASIISKSKWTMLVHFTSAATISTLFYSKIFICLYDYNKQWRYSWRCFYFSFAYTHINSTPIAFMNRL